MRAIQIVFVILIFNFAMSFMVDADIFGSGVMYYENTMTDIEGPGNLSTSSELERITGAFGKFAGMVGYLSFDWIGQLVPAVMANHSLFSTMIMAGNSILLLLISVAVIEAVLKRWGILE